MRSAFDMVSAWASVLATTKSTPWSPAVIMLLTALPPAPPTPNTVMRGFISRMSGIVRLIVMRLPLLMHERLRQSACRQVGPVRHRPPGKLRGSETLAQPSSDPCHVTACTRHQLPRSPRFEMFKMRRLRIDQQARGDREGRSLGRFGQTGEPERAADAHRAPENACGEIGKA